MPDMTITICVAVPLLLLSFGMFVGNILFTLRAERTTGIVVDYETRRGSKGGATQAEVVEFQGPDGKTVRFVEKTSRSRFIMNTGHEVNVLYDPDNPEKARINSFWTLYISPIILLIVGLSLMIFNVPMFSGLGENILNWLQNFIDKVPFL